VIQGTRVILMNASAAEDDPVLDGFLQFLARDIEADPEHIAPIPAELLAQAHALTHDAGPTGHDAPIEGETVL